MTRFAHAAVCMAVVMAAPVAVRQMRQYCTGLDVVGRRSTGGWSLRMRAFSQND